MRAPTPFQAIFTSGSITRHLLVMTGTASVGVMAIFVVDALSLLYVSRLGETHLTAAVGYASQILFFPVGINIGVTIAMTALVARALGAGETPRARKIAAAGLVMAATLSTIVMIAALALTDDALTTFGATGDVFDAARRFLHITLPANVPFGLGMALSGILRATGDARRAMYVTLSGAVVTAIVDPVLIFGLGLGIDGAAITTVLSRFVFLLVGFHGASRIHGLVGRPDWASLKIHALPLTTIAIPAIMTNLATPIANSYAIHVFAKFGDSAVAAAAIIDRIVPVAFGAIFALSGAIGPILGQNLGALQFPRVHETLSRAFLLTGGYTLTVWGIMALVWPWVAQAFGANPLTAHYIGSFCSFGMSAWLFIGFLFVANAAFNNLGFPLLSMAFNWGRATLGTIPFVTLGASWAGVEGGQIGIAIGAAVFGLAALATAYVAVNRLIAKQAAVAA